MSRNLGFSFVFLFAIALSLVFLSHAQLFGASNQDRAQKVVKNAAKELGWPDNTAPRQGALGTSYEITPTGSHDDPEYWAAISVSSDAETEMMLQTLQDNGLRRSSYNGRDAIIMRKGEKVCDYKEGSVVDIVIKVFVKPLAAAIAEAMGEEFDESQKICADSYGTIAWRCGPYLFMTQDQSEAGGEQDAAAAMYRAAEAENLCGMGDTIVILAETDDVAGGKTLSTYQEIAQGVNSYYGKNAYGKASFTYTYKDADGSNGKQDWYKVSGTMAANSAAGMTPFIEKATQEAFKSGIDQDAYVERIIVVHSGKSKQTGNNDSFSTACSWKDNNYAIEVGGLLNKKKIYAKNLIIVGEEDSVGDWAHEIGHSLYSKQKMFGTYERISDRYNYQNNSARQYGYLGPWSLMGNGNYWGSPAGSAPTHMDSFTKEQATWLSYQNVMLNKSITDKSLEAKEAGDFVYKLQDPRPGQGGYYVIEARDSAVSYGAPESGVMVYYAWFDNVNDHYVVNIAWPDIAQGVGTGPGGRQYVRPTLGSGTNNSWYDPNTKLNFTFESEGTGPYSATFKVVKDEPVNLTGAVAAPVPPAAGAAGTGSTLNDQGWDVPDIDLHAYDGQGRHVGVNYQTNNYERQIPGAFASGNFINAPEWIYVPAGTDVRYEISAERTKQFLQKHSEFQGAYGTQEVKTQYVKYGANGQCTYADGGSVQTTTAGDARTAMKSPDDGSLGYAPANMAPGIQVGTPKSEGCGCLPGMVLLVVAGFVLTRKE